MEENNPVVRLCAEGMPYEGEDERALRNRANGKEDYEACLAAHHLARRSSKPAGRHTWNRDALMRADAASNVGDGRVRAFYPVLYLNLGKSHEEYNNPVGARECYDEALNKAGVLPDNDHGNMVKREISAGLGRTIHTEE